MLPASVYTPLYYHAMLLVVFGVALVYCVGLVDARNLPQVNQVAMILIGVAVALFVGFRPVSGVFIDMTNYARSYERVQQGGAGNLPDRVFNGLMQLCAPVLPMGGFFFVCALIYIVPLAVASWRVHGSWAFPVFLAFLTAFSFWGYGVNGIRNGMATSVLILAFSFHTKPLVMLPLMAAALGLHGTAVLPAGAFLLVRYVKKTEIWMAFWLVCVAISLIAGNVGGLLLSLYNPVSWDERVESYILGSGSSGFRADFVAYSIIPVLVTLLLAAPTRARLGRYASRAMSRPKMHWMRNRSPMPANLPGMGKLVAVQGLEMQGRLACAALGPTCRDPRSGSEGVKQKLPHQHHSMPRGSANRAGWNRLPWGRLLQSDAFYARLVNTYLLANSLWILLIEANFSNRFAYLSWFMMPWVLLYPFVPGKIVDRPRTRLIAGILCGQYLFTYVMGIVIYPMRGIQ